MGVIIAIPEDLMSPLEPEPSVNTMTKAFFNTERFIN